MCPIHFCDRTVFHHNVACVKQNKDNEAKKVNHEQIKRYEADQICKKKKKKRKQVDTSTIKSPLKLSINEAVVSLLMNDFLAGGL